MKKSLRSVAVFALLLAAAPCYGHDDSKAASKSPEQLGKVAFANSCSAEVQPAFARAVALLHSFWFSEGEKAFRDVLAHDPDCAIAHWGIAAILISNPYGPGPPPPAVKKAQEAIASGRSRQAATQRERDYLDAVAAYYEEFAARSQSARLKALAAAFGALADRYADDEEARIFAAFYLATTQSPEEKTFADTLKAAAMLEPLFAKYPEHPGVAHYLIHSYDFPPIADRGLPAARRYAQIAPSAPHAVHMPSHIFTRVGAWADSVQTNQRSARSAREDNDRNGELHAMDYMVYAYLQTGRDREARQTQDEAAAQAAPGTNFGGDYALAAIPARVALERGDWHSAAQLPLRQSSLTHVGALTHFARAIGAARGGNVPLARQEADQLASVRDVLTAAKSNYWATEVEVQRLAAMTWVAFAGSDKAQALSQMRAAADLEDRSEKAAVSPGRLLPAHELLGEMLLELGRPAEALVEFELSHKRDPNRLRGLYGAGHAAELAGDADKARTHFKRLLDIAGGAEARSEVVHARRYLGGA